MAFIAVAAGIGVAGSLIGGAVASSGAKKAASTQADSTKYAADLSYKTGQDSLALQKEAYNKQLELQQPWIEAGKGALNKLAAIPDFSYTGSNLSSDPGYQFRLAEGQKALQAKQAQSGRLLGGAAVKQAQRYGQDYASGEFSNAYNRALNTYSTNLNRTMQTAGLGQVATGAASNAAGNYGAGAANTTLSTGAQQADLATQAGNARASGYMGASNAWANAINGATGSIMYGAVNRGGGVPAPTLGTYDIWGGAGGPMG